MVRRYPTTAHTMKLAMLLFSVLSLATAGAEVSEASACVDEGAPWNPNLCSELKKQTPKQIKKSCKKSTQGGAYLKYCKLTCGKCSPPTPTPEPSPTPSPEPYLGKICNPKFLGACGSSLFPSSGLTCQCEVFGPTPTCTCQPSPEPSPEPSPGPSPCVDLGPPEKPDWCSELKKRTPKQIKKSCKQSKYCKRTCGKCSPPTPTPEPSPTPSPEPYLGKICNPKFLGACGSSLFPSSGLTCQCEVFGPTPTCTCQPSPEPSPEPSPTPSPEPSPGPSCEDLDDAMKGGKNKCKLAEKCKKAKKESDCKLKLCERDGCKKWNKEKGKCKKEGKKRCSKTCCELSEGSSPTKKCENTCEFLYKICKFPCAIVGQSSLKDGKKCDKACSKAKKLCDTACRLE